MKPKAKKKIISMPVLLFALVFIAYITLASIPFVLTQLFSFTQRSQKIKFENESKRLGSTLDKLSCKLKTSKFTPNVDASPYLTQIYMCQTNDASKIASVISDGGLLNVDPNTNKPYPPGTYSIRNGSIYDEISIGNSELNLKISD